MSILSSRRNRRLTNNQVEKRQNFLTFSLRKCWFALSIESVKKVIPLEQIYGDLKNTGISLTRYENQELLVIDVGHRIFGDRPQINNYYSLNDNQQSYLAIVQNQTGGLVALPMDLPPIIRRVTDSDLTSIPDAYLVKGNLQCISTKMVRLTDHPPLFIIDPEQLVSLIR